jgi:hypothetical protein
MGYPIPIANSLESKSEMLTREIVNSKGGDKRQSRPVHARSSMRAVWESGLSEGPDCLVAYLSELRFINPRSDTSEF